jgi:hypothetical protein
VVRAIHRHQPFKAVEPISGKGISISAKWILAVRKLMPIRVVVPRSKSSFQAGLPDGLFSDQKSKFG